MGRTNGGGESARGWQSCSFQRDPKTGFTRLGNVILESLDVIYYKTPIFGRETAALYEDILGVPVLIECKRSGITIRPVDASATIRAIGVVRAPEARDERSGVIALIAENMASDAIKGQKRELLSGARRLADQASCLSSLAFAAMMLKMLGSRVAKDGFRFKDMSKLEGNTVSKAF